MDLEKDVEEDVEENVVEDMEEDTEEGLVENLEEVLEEFGQSPQKQCPKPIGPFQGHPLNQKEILSYSNQLALIRTTSSICGHGEGGGTWRRRWDVEKEVAGGRGHCGGCGGAQGGGHG